MMRMRLPIIPGAACPLLIALLFLSACKDEKNTYVPPPPAAVGVAKPLHQQVVPYLEATGNTVAFNEVNLVENIQPTRARATLVLHKGADHAVTRVRLRRF